VQYPERPQSQRSEGSWGGSREPPTATKAKKTTTKTTTTMTTTTMTARAASKTSADAAAATAADSRSGSHSVTDWENLGRENEEKRKQRKNSSSVGHERRGDCRDADESSDEDNERERPQKRAKSDMNSEDGKRSRESDRSNSKSKDSKGGEGTAKAKASKDKRKEEQEEEEDDDERKWSGEEWEAYDPLEETKENVDPTGADKRAADDPKLEDFLSTRLFPDRSPHEEVKQQERLDWDDRRKRDREQQENAGRDHPKSSDQSPGSWTPHSQNDCSKQQQKRQNQQKQQEPNQQQKRKHDENWGPRPPAGPPPQQKQGGRPRHHKGKGGKGDGRGGRKTERVHVAKIHFSQNSIGSFFKCGKSISSTLEELQEGKVTTEEKFFKIEVVMFDDKYYTINNRRLWCLKEYQKTLSSRLEVQVKMIAMDPAIAAFFRNFTTTNGGTEVEIRPPARNGDPQNQTKSEAQESATEA